MTFVYLLSYFTSLYNTNDDTMVTESDLNAGGIWQQKSWSTLRYCTTIHPQTVDIYEKPYSRIVKFRILMELVRLATMCMYT